jgi:two-component system response regulator AtoC
MRWQGQPVSAGLSSTESWATLVSGAGAYDEPEGDRLEGVGGDGEEVMKRRFGWLEEEENRDERQGAVHVDVEEQLDATKAPEPSDELGSEWLDLNHLSWGAERMAGMVGRSEALHNVFNAIRQLAPHKSTVLVQGESGTGKELVARSLHTYGPNPRGSFVIFNCSNLVDSLAESQLFGHVRGAFTDAREESQGYFRAAQGGTLLLDEIGELPMRLQAKLLRAVETHEIQPVGSSQSRHVDFRLIAATNRDLRAMVKAGEFRDDLYYRLNSTSIYVPPLRKRIGDVEVLTAHYIEYSNRLLEKSIRYISRRALDVLLAHKWPGNVRELAHAIESAVLMSTGDRVDIADLPADVRTEVEGSYDFSAAHPLTAPSGRDARATNERPWQSALQGVMKDALLRSLEETAGNNRRAADLLGVSRSTFYRMLSRYGIARTGRRGAVVRPLPSIPGSPREQ